MDFEQAFSYSCVWYFRKIIDEIGQERMQEALEKLSYGNCDISDWEGRLNQCQLVKPFQKVRQGNGERRHRKGSAAFSGFEIKNS